MIYVIVFRNAMGDSIAVGWDPLYSHRRIWVCYCVRDYVGAVEVQLRGMRHLHNTLQFQPTPTMGHLSFRDEDRLMRYLWMRRIVQLNGDIQEISVPEILGYILGYSSLYYYPALPYI